MAKEEKYYCDFCGKEIWSQGACTSVLIQAVQSPREEVHKHLQKMEPWVEREYSFLGSRMAYPTWKHRQAFAYMICEECLGEKITVNMGDTARFNVEHGFKKFLRKLGIVKKEPS